MSGFEPGTVDSDFNLTALKLTLTIGQQSLLADTGEASTVGGDLRPSVRLFGENLTDETDRKDDFLVCSADQGGVQSFFKLLLLNVTLNEAGDR